MIRLVIFGLHVLDQIDDTARVSKLVVVPRNQFDKVLVESNTGPSIEDGRVVVTDKVCRNNLKTDNNNNNQSFLISSSMKLTYFFIAVAQDSLHRAFRCSVDGSLDFIVASLLGQSDSQIDDRNVVNGDAESHAGQLAVQFGNYFANSLGSAGGGRDDVLSGTTSVTPQLLKNVSFFVLTLRISQT